MAIPTSFPLNVEQIISISFPDLSIVESAPIPSEPVSGESKAAASSREKRDEQKKAATEARNESKKKLIEKLKTTITQKLDEVNKGIVDIGKGSNEIVQNVGKLGVLKVKITATETLVTVIDGVNTAIEALSSTPASLAAAPMGSMNDNQSTAENNKIDAWKAQYDESKNVCVSALARMDSGISSVKGFCDLLMLSKVGAVSTFLDALDAEYNVCSDAVSTLS